MAIEGPRALVAGNWKMNGGVAMLKEPRLLAAMLKDVKLKCDVMVCPPTVIARRVKSVLKGSRIRLGGQDCHWAASGAHTGDISAEMLREAGATAVEYAIVASMIAAIIVAVVLLVGQDASANFDTVSGKF